MFACVELLIVRKGLVVVMTTIALFGLWAISGSQAQEVGTSTHELARLLAAASPVAVEESARLGVSALPVLRRFAMDENYQVRKLTMQSAGRVGVVDGADILERGIRDTNVNVQAVAASELAKRAYPAATDAILEILQSDTDLVVRENLALAAGFLQGKRVIGVLKSVSRQDSSLGVMARMALVRLGDGVARRGLTAELRSSLPRIRYTALEKLVYVDDIQLARDVTKLLHDEAEAVRVGFVEFPRFRRVCDQAVDTLIALLKLKVPFEAGVDKNYSAPERKTVSDMAKRCGLGREC